VNAQSNCDSSKRNGRVARPFDVSLYLGCPTLVALVWRQGGSQSPNSPDASDDRTASAPASLAGRKSASALANASC